GSGAWSCGSSARRCAPTARGCPGARTPACGSLLLGLLPVALAEAVDAALAVDLARLPRPERVARRRDLELDDRDLLALDGALLGRGERRAREPLLAGRRVDEQHLVVVGVDAGLHDRDRLPARLAHARELAAQRHLAQRDAGEGALAVEAARAAGDAAAPLQPRDAGVAPELPEAPQRGHLVVEGRVGIAHHLAQHGALGGVLADQARASLVAQPGVALAHG